MRKDSCLVMSYLTMRKVIGILGASLPMVLLTGGLLGGSGVEPSISDYYFTNMQDFFVGLMCAVGIFLITYKGHEPVDNITTNICGLCAVGLALLPTIKAPGCRLPVGIFLLPNNITVILHFVFSALFLLGLAAIPFFLFTKGEVVANPEKLKRNRVYRACGISIAAMFAGIVAAKLFMSYETLSSSRIVLVLETLALWAFGFSWWVKGETLWVDKPAPERG